MRFLLYPLIRGNRYWKRRSITRLQTVFLGGYFVANGFCMGLSLGDDKLSGLMTRCGLMASINLIPLFCRGRTSSLANFLGISLYTYYLAHYWAGRVVIFQGLLYVGAAVVSRRPWTFDLSQILGITASKFISMKPEN